LLKKKKKEERKKFQKILDPILKFFEWGFYLGGIEAAYLNFVTYT